MFRAKAFSRIQASGLILFLALLPAISWANPFIIGEVTQVEGEATFFNFLPPRSVQAVKVGQKVKTEGSYLTSENSFITLKLFGQDYIRLTPQSKISLEFDPKEGVTTVYLLSGSFKALFAQNEQKPMAIKLVVKSGSTVFETVNGKFAAVRNILTDTNSVYVEKGSVLVEQFLGTEKKDSEIVHALEGTTVFDNEGDVPSPTELDENKLKFLQPAFYLKKKKAL